MERRSKRTINKAVIAVFVLIIVYVAWGIFRPIPLIKPESANIEIKQNTASQLDWPNKGQSAVGFVNSDYVDSNGTQKPAPIASVAKVITALVVLEKKPLKLGEQGPTITLTASDEQLYHNYKANDGSIVPSANGEKITQYQMLQAMMLPSANNMSDSLAIWAFGSIDNYIKEANSYVKRNGMTNTKIGGDASGLNPATVSTAEDLIKLGKLTMKNPVMASIVSQQTATGIPLTTTVKNVNILLGNSNIVGIKTGNTDEAGGAFLSASIIAPNQKPVTIITAVLQANNLYDALASSLSLVKSSQKAFVPVEITKQDQVVGIYKAPWGGSAKAIATRDLTINSFASIKPEYQVALDPIRQSTKSGDNVGQVVIKKSFQSDTKTVPIILQGEIAKPSIAWRLTHPFSI